MTHYFRLLHIALAAGASLLGGASAQARFLQPDPVGYASGSNLYAYVSNDPLNGIDPIGLTTYYLSLGGSLARLLAGDASGGLYITNNSKYGLPDIGYFTSYGAGVGITPQVLSVSAVAGFVSGPLSNFTGRTDVLNASYGIVTTSQIYPAHQALTSPIGGAAGVQTPGAGVSLVNETTSATGIGDTLLDALHSVLGTNNGLNASSTPEGDAFLATLNSITTGLGGPGK